MKKLINAFIWILFFSSQSLRAEDFHLNIGSNQNIKIRPNEKIKIKGSAYIRAKDLGSHLLVTAVKVGVSEIHTTDQIHKIYVIENAKTEFFSELQGLLINFMDLETEIRDGQIHIIGQLHRLSDWQDIHSLAVEKKAAYLMSATIDSDIKDSCREWIQSIFSKINSPTPHITWDYGIEAHFSEKLKPLDHSTSSALGSLGIKTVYDKSQLEVLPLIRVKVIVAEVNRTMQSHLGVQWPDAIAAQVLPKITGPTSLDVMMHAMEQKGMGQILASPNLLAKSGSEAEFLAGGEFAIKIISPRMRDVVWKKHGISLKIKPKADRTGQISMELTTEVSIIDASQAIDGVPGLKTNRMSTHFDLKTSRTIALSGLIRSDWGKSRSGITGLKDIPVIGKLFGSEDFFKNKTELVIFVTPEIIDPAAPSEPLQYPQQWSGHD